MPTIAAGTFAMNCAFHGIPVIGYDEADTQRKCHPDLSVKQGDLEQAVKLAKKLKNNDGFYQDCSIRAKENWEKFFSEEVFKKHMKEIFS
jgi:hypothetical protein